MTNKITLNDKQFAIVRNLVRNEMHTSTSVIVQDLCRMLLDTQFTTERDWSDLERFPG